MRDSIGDYKVLDKIGTGDTSEVFRARDTRLGRTAAIKVLTSEVAMDASLGPAFVREANLAAGIGHPNVAALYEIDEQDGQAHLVFEFVPGQTLRSVLGGRPLNVRQAIEYATQVADGLADAHAGGVVHRMLRPDKVIITMKGTAKIIDMGLGQYAMAVARRASGTAPAMAYWAPEQVAGAPGDHRADIWALGQLLTEMLTGTPPTPGSSFNASAVPAQLRSLLTRMSAPSPAARPQSAATVASELRTIAAAVDARREAAPPPAPVAVREQPAFPAWALALVVVLAIGVVIWLAVGS